MGHRPFDDDHTNLFQVLQRIAVEEPTGPSTRWSDLDVDTRDVIAQQRHLEPAALHKSLRGDLDWIVLKAIARDRDQRYGSTAELAADIQRYLRHEPVEASPWPATFVEPDLFCSVTFLERTSGGELRAPVFAELIEGS